MSVNLRKIFVLLFIFFSCVFNQGCKRCGLFTLESYTYSGDLDLAKYKWMKGKKIFLDPGHGGKGDSDRFRIGPEGITEEEINLKAALILEDMLNKAGAEVFMSRDSDKDIPLNDRVEMVKKTGPDLLISLHHNGSPRRMDSVNYPSALIWGHKDISPQSYHFAQILLDEFHRIMDEKGNILSDFSVYKETGTMILRETRYMCPGVIGEAGFFSDEKQAKMLSDIQYLQREAEAYFLAAARFFELGLPKAEVLISSQINDDPYLSSVIEDESPVIAIKTYSGLDAPGINNRSLKAALDDIPVRCRPAADDLFFVNYGRKLYPGGHKLRFSFQNNRGQPSMIYGAAFTVKIKKGDYDRLSADGIRLIKHARTREEGLKMLLSAISMSLTDPGVDRLLWNAAETFKKLSQYGTSDYYHKRLYYFYPESKYSKEPRFSDYRFPVDFYGKWIPVIYEPSLKDRGKNKK